MGLPKIDLPIMELELPSTGEKVKYRPFTVKEEKILLVASESEDAEQEVLAAKQVVNNCLIDKDVSTLAMFDLEYVLLILRSRSVNNSITFNIRDPETDEQVQLEIDINKVKVTKDPEHTNEVKVTDDYTLFLRYPTIDEFISIIRMDPKDPLTNYYLLISCLDKLASEDEVYDFAEYKQEDIDAFMDNLSGDVIKDIQQFFETMPKLRHEIPYKNSKGTEQTFVVEGTRSFFI